MAPCGRQVAACGRLIPFLSLLAPWIATALSVRPARAPRPIAASLVVWVGASIGPVNASVIRDGRLANSWERSARQANH